MNGPGKFGVHVLRRVLRKVTGTNKGIEIIRSPVVKGINQLELLTV